ncbi:MAG: TPM domain-containing protein [Clostridia bacterium]|nr:TPM domain-containing protein [Clostridia bacterium]
MIVRRIVSLLLALLLCAGLVLPAGAETQYPSFQGIVTDLAGVLGEDTVQDLSLLAERMSDASLSLGSFYVVTRHFLGGTDAAVYAKALFEAWDLGWQDVLLLMVIGEEKYALYVGDGVKAALSADTQTSLLATHFRSAFLNRKYDEAVADLAVQTVQTIAKAGGTSVNTAGLFGTAAVSATHQPTAQSLTNAWESMFAFQDFEEDDDWPLDIQYSNYSGFNWRGWLIWGLLIYFVFFRKKKSYNFGHGPRGRR